LKPLIKEYTEKSVNASYLSTIKILHCIRPPRHQHNQRTRHPPGTFCNF